MDIQVASNFERYLFELADRDSARLQGWMADFERGGELTVEPERFARVERDFLSAAVDEDTTLETIRRVYREHGYLLDPHSAVGVAAAAAQVGKAEATPTVCMATAHPAKFGEAICTAIGKEPALPAALQELEGLPTRVEVLPADRERVKGFIRKTLAARAAAAELLRPVEA